MQPLALTLGEPAGIGDETRRREVNAAGKISGQMRLARRNRLCVEDFAGHAVLARTRGVFRRVGETCLGPIDLEPSGAAQEFGNAGFVNQRFMFNEALADQRQQFEV